MDLLVVFVDENLLMLYTRLCVFGEKLYLTAKLWFAILLYYWSLDFSFLHEVTFMKVIKSDGIRFLRKIQKLTFLDLFRDFWPKNCHSGAYLKIASLLFLETW